MTAGRSIPGSAQERCARRALVNSLDRSGGTFAAAETQSGTTLHAAMTCYGEPTSAQWPLWNRYLGNPGQGLEVRTPNGDIKVGPAAALSKYRQQLAMLRAAERRFDSSLFEIRQLVQADLFDSEVEAARELLKNKFIRAAGAVAGVVLERHLKQVCDDHGIKIGKISPTVAVFNQTLRDADVIDVPQWRFNQHLVNIRNLCDHNKAREPTKEQVQDLIDGTAKVLKTIA